MYTRFFGLNEKPFSIAPDPRYLFMSERHTEALAHLIYGVRESGGFIQLTGEVGTGKTTLIRSLLQQLPDSTDVALILNPQLSTNEFLSTICEELGVPPMPDSINSNKALVKAFNAYLLNNHSQGRRTIVIIDEAQNLGIDVLEQVRLLTNLETTRQKLLQIILIGQPELRDLLACTDMRQLAQRITGRYHLEPLTPEETEAYIDHRLKVAGSVGQVFSKAAKRELYRLSGGVPRRINVIADRAMLGAFTLEIRQVTPQLLRKATAEVLGLHSSNVSPWHRWTRIAGTALVLLAIVIAIAWTLSEWSRSPAGAKATPEATIVKPPELGFESEPNTMPDQTLNAPGLAGGERLEAILRNNGTTTQIADAFEALFAFWSIDYVYGPEAACDQAEREKLYCLSQRGSLAQIRRLDRPVILSLFDHDGKKHHVVLSGLNDDAAIVSIADDDYTIRPTELNNFWFGEYLLLWRPQFNELTRFSPGMRDEGIRWLRQSLAKIQGEPITPMSSDFYDSNLEARVRSYQRERRLGVDGVVGYQTQIAINSDLGPIDRPSLARMN